MRERQVVIYTAANSHQAHLLKNQLADYGVWCVVQSDSHESTDGLVAAPQVVVRAEDFEFAREVALDFDRTLSRPNEEPAADEDEASGPNWSNWPRCPSCRRPRQTRCPVCKSAGTDFALAEFIAPEDPEKHVRFVADDSEDDDEPVLLICPLCDDTFAPQFYRRCEACGHDFGHGLEVRPITAATFEPLNTRIILVVGGLIATLVALLGYWVAISRS